RSPRRCRMKRPERMHLVFVYGTLLRGQPNHPLIARSRCVEKRAWTTPSYRFVDLGPFPAMLASGTTAVRGEVYAVDDETLAHLDMLEGHPSFYERRPIQLASGLEVQAYFLVRASTPGGTPITSGDWRHHITRPGQGILS